MYSLLPLDPLQHCLVKTGCKLIIVDPERADKLEPVAGTFLATGSAFLVIESHERKGNWDRMSTWDTVVAGHKGDRRQVLLDDPGLGPEDNATIIFTSGTTGLPSSYAVLRSWDRRILTTTIEGVLSTQRMFLTNVFNVSLPSNLILYFTFLLTLALIRASLA